MGKLVRIVEMGAVAFDTFDYMEPFLDKQVP